jgi:uncharacterized repeat protein (TIGR02543 family)
MTVGAGKTFTAPASPSYTGYTFAGWFTDAACTVAWNFSSDPVIANMTLYAKWTINSYIVSFDSQGGNPISPLSAVYNSTITAPVPPTKTGYVFNGWYLEIAGINAWNFSTGRIQYHLTLFAKWTINVYTVTFNSNGGSAVSPVQANYNSTISAPVMPVRAGFAFAGWFKDASFTNRWTFATDTVTSASTIYAKWIRYGDINNDGTVTATDALMVLQAASGKITLSADGTVAADVNFDARTSAVDALKILQFSAGRITSF